MRLIMRLNSAYALPITNAAFLHGIIIATFETHRFVHLKFFDGSLFYLKIKQKCWVWHEE